MTISANTVRYIKLGRGGRWEDASFERQELHFGYGKTPHEMASLGNFDEIKQYLIDLGRDAQSASREAREVLDFYELGSDCLWITFARDHLWWAFADPEVTWRGGHGTTEGERTRKVIGSWRNTDVNGEPLRMESLSTSLTKVAGYRRTICSVKAEKYLLNRINGVVDPLIAQSAPTRNALVQDLLAAITKLHWKDFETLIDVVIARSGWHRVSALGGTQKTIDLEVEHTATNEVAAVQIKSAASQQTLDEYIERIDEAERYDRSFFVCHSPKGHLAVPPDRSDVHVWSGDQLATTVFKLGLFDWVFEKIA